MTSELMQNLQRSTDDAVWALAPGASMTLTAHAHGRLIQACEGRLWVTTQGTSDRAALDVWLTTGQTLALEPGTDVVLEGWPSARFRLLVPAMAPEARPHWSDRVVRTLARLRPAGQSPLLAGA
jgi:hypothetical protein